MADQYGHRDNNDRADAARAALDAYIATNTPHYASEPIEDQVGDLLCDLLHLVRREGDETQEPAPLLGREYPTHLLDRARSNFEAEEEEEDGGEEGTEDEEEEHPDTDSLEDRGLTLGSYGS